MDMALGFKGKELFEKKADESDWISDSPAFDALLEDIGQDLADTFGILV